MKINQLTANKNLTLKKVMKKIDENGLGTCFIVDSNNKFVGLVTDGDIRRALLKGADINEKIWKIMNKNPIVLYSNEVSSISLARYEKKLPKYGSLKIPILNKEKRICDVLIVDHLGNMSFLKKHEKHIRPNIKSVLVIGGAGYLGSILVRKLLSLGFKVKVLDNLMYGDFGIRDLKENSNFILIKGDVRNVSDVMDAIKDCDAVIHLAAIVGDPASAEDPQRTIEINYFAAKMVAEVCKYNQINRFIFASTCSVYGASSGKKELTEDSELNPVSLYAKTKISSERAILQMADENFSPTILRMGTLYGASPRMRFDLVVNLLTAKAYFENEITIFGGKQWRPFLQVEDAADAYIACLRTPIEKIRGKVFNLGGTNHRIEELQTLLKKFFPKLKVVVKDTSKDLRDYRVSSIKMAQTLGIQPKKSLQDGIKEILNWLKKNKIKDYKLERFWNKSP